MFFDEVLMVAALMVFNVVEEYGDGREKEKVDGGIEECGRRKVLLQGMA